MDDSYVDLKLTLPEAEVVQTLLLKAGAEHDYTPRGGALFKVQQAIERFRDRR